MVGIKDVLADALAEQFLDEPSQPCESSAVMLNMPAYCYTYTLQRSIKRRAVLTFGGFTRTPNACVSGMHEISGLAIVITYTTCSHDDSSRLYRLCLDF